MLQVKQVADDHQCIQSKALVLFADLKIFRRGGKGDGEIKTCRGSKTVMYRKQQPPDENASQKHVIYSTEFKTQKNTLLLRIMTFI